MKPWVLPDITNRISAGQITVRWRHRVERAGVEIDPKTGIPRHDAETMETNVPGLYIAGVIAAGLDANKIFIENGRHHGGKIVRAMLDDAAG